MARLTRDVPMLAASGGLRFGRVGDPLHTADGVAEVASLEDLLAHELEVSLQRAERRGPRRASRR